MKTVLISGASRGIGYSICKAFVEEEKENYFVYGLSRTVEGVKTINELGATGILCDVSKDEDVDSLKMEIKSKGHSIDILINNAGIAKSSLFVKTRMNDLNDIMNVNFYGSARLIKCFVNDMSKNKCGRIINISSVLSLMPQVGFSAYTSSKAALDGLTKSLALEYASKGITVNSVNPGFVNTSMLEVIGDKGDELKMNIPCGYAAEPDDISPLVLFLASDKARYITGESIQINGGLYFS
jgi:3-oxoacyl-[acyl-carrier protein] reductase